MGTSLEVALFNLLNKRLFYHVDWEKVIQELSPQPPFQGPFPCMRVNRLTWSVVWMRVKFSEKRAWGPAKTTQQRQKVTPLRTSMLTSWAGGTNGLSDVWKKPSLPAFKREEELWHQFTTYKWALRSFNFNLTHTTDQVSRQFTALD